MARTAQVVIGDRDCSSACITALKAAGIPTGGASYTGNIRACFLATGQWEAKPVSFIASPGDLYLREGNHVAMCLQQVPDQLMEFSHNESWGYYNGRVGDQLNNSGASAESHIRSYYDYPWNVIMHYKGGNTQAINDAVKIMKFMCEDPRFGYTMSDPGRWGNSSLGYATIVLDDSPSPSTDWKLTMAVDNGFSKKNASVSGIGSNKKIAFNLGSSLKFLSIYPSKGTIRAQAYTKYSGWLPALYNPSNINDKDSGSVGDGNSILGLRLYLDSPNGDYSLFYRVKVNGSWYDWLQDGYEMNANGTVKIYGDDYAGDLVHSIQAIEAYIGKATY